MPSRRRSSPIDRLFPRSIRAASQPAEAWVPRAAEEWGGRLRLFCFPSAGGSASAFQAWPARFPADIQVCPVHLPGRQERITEAPHSRLALLVRTLAGMLHPYLPTPFALFGHSMGALIAFELARQLRREGRPSPAHLIVSAFPAPHLIAPGPSIHALPDPSFLGALQRAGAIPEAMQRSPELLHLMLPTLRADIALCERYIYVPDTPLTCSLSAFGGAYDSTTGYHTLLAWRQQTVGSFTLRLFPGDHSYLDQLGPQVTEAIVSDLGRTLARLLPPPASRH